MNNYILSAIVSLFLSSPFLVIGQQEDSAAPMLDPDEAVESARFLAEEYIRAQEETLQDTEQKWFRDTIEIDIRSEQAFMLLLHRLEEKDDLKLLGPAVVFRFLADLVTLQYNTDPEFFEATPEEKQKIQERKDQLMTFLEIFEEADPEIAEILQSALGNGIDLEKNAETDSIDPDKMEMAHAMVEASQMEMMIDKTIEQMTGLQRQQVQGLNLNDTEMREFEETMIKIEEVAREILDPEIFKDVMARNFATIYTMEEMEAAIEFYTSELGQSIVAKTPEVNQATIEWVQSKTPEIQQRIMELDR